uniref:RING-type E3 ubiquitin transferase n=1 Tax=Solanum tuberosum TaxID=4113 RepID=M1B9X9_SOLTU
MASSQDSHSFHWEFSEFDDNDFQIRGHTLFFVILLFTIIVIATLFFLYARWINKFRSPSTTDPVGSGTSVHTPPPAPQGLDPIFINDLPIILHATCSGSSTVIECCICLGIFQDGDKVKVLPSCQHSYHSDCVDRWLRNQSSCPLCRASLQFDLPL